MVLVEQQLGRLLERGGATGETAKTQRAPCLTISGPGDIAFVDPLERVHLCQIAPDQRWHGRRRRPLALRATEAHRSVGERRRKRLRRLLRSQEKGHTQCDSDG